MKKWIGLLALLTAACGSLPTKEGYAQKVYAWQGRDANELLATWGAPDKTMTMPNGNTLYTYNKSSVQQQPMFENRRYEPGTRITVNDNGQSRVIETPGRWVYDGMTGGGVMTYRCVTNFVVDKKTQEVESVSFEGNNCLAPPRQ